MEPCCRVSREEFFHSSFCGRFFVVSPGRAVSGGSCPASRYILAVSMGRAAAGRGGGRLHTSFLNLADTGCQRNLPVAAGTPRHLTRHWREPL
jgi:hypothetical protein